MKKNLFIYFLFQYFSQIFFRNNQKNILLNVIITAGKLDTRLSAISAASYDGVGESYEKERVKKGMYCLAVIFCSNHSYSYLCTL